MTHGSIFSGIGGFDLAASVDRLESLGNAIVPQVAYEIFKAIKETETLELR